MVCGLEMASFVNVCCLEMASFVNGLLFGNDKFYECSVVYKWQAL